MWGLPLQRVQQEVQALKREQVAADVVGEKLKGVESRLRRTEEELRMEKDRRSQLEVILSQGRK